MNEERSRVLTNTRTPGLPGARNTGALASQRDILAFCDDDDLWSPGKLEAQVALLDTHPAMEVVTCGLFIDAKGRITIRVLPSDRVTFRDLLRSRVMEAHPSTYVVRRKAMLDGIGLVDEKIPGGYGEDYDWLLRAARRHDIGAVRLPLTKIYWHRSSFFAERWQTIIDALDYLLAKYPEFAEEPTGLARILGQQAFALGARCTDRPRRGPRPAKRSASIPANDAAYLAYLTSNRLLRSDRTLRRVAGCRPRRVMSDAQLPSAVAQPAVPARTARCSAGVATSSSPTGRSPGCSSASRCGGRSASGR